MKIVYPRNVYQVRDTLFDKLDSFGIKNTSEQKVCRNLELLEFESICVQEETFRDTNTTTWIGKHVPISVSITANLVEEPIFFCNSDPHHLVASFIGALEFLATQGRAKVKNLFLDIKSTKKIKLGNILENLSQGDNRREHAMFGSQALESMQDDNEICATTHFLQIQKKSNK